MGKCFAIVLKYFLRDRKLYFALLFGIINTDKGKFNMHSCIDKLIVA